MNDFLTAVQPALIALALAVISGGTLVATVYFRSLANKLNEGKDREALHQALATGARVALNEGQTLSPGNGRAIVDRVQEYARKSSPGAVSRLNPTQEVFDQLAVSKIVEEANKQAPAVMVQK